MYAVVVLLAGSTYEMPTNREKNRSVSYMLKESEKIRRRTNNREKILLEIASGESIYKKIYEKLSLTPPTMSRNCKILEEKGLIIVTNGPLDLRKRHLVLTEKGLALGGSLLRSSQVAGRQAPTAAEAAVAEQDTRGLSSMVQVDVAGRILEPADENSFAQAIGQLVAKMIAGAPAAAQPILAARILRCCSIEERKPANVDCH